MPRARQCPVGVEGDRNGCEQNGLLGCRATRQEAARCGQILPLASDGLAKTPSFRDTLDRQIIECSRATGLCELRFPAGGAVLRLATRSRSSAVLTPQFFTNRRN